jgi:hypothetical protein
MVAVIGSGSHLVIQQRERARGLGVIQDVLAEFHRL